MARRARLRFLKGMAISRCASITSRLISEMRGHQHRKVLPYNGKNKLPLFMPELELHCCRACRGGCTVRQDGPESARDGTSLNCRKRRTIRSIVWYVRSRISQAFAWTVVDQSAYLFWVCDCGLPRWCRRTASKGRRCLGADTNLAAGSCCEQRRSYGQVLRRAAAFDRTRRRGIGADCRPVVHRIFRVTTTGRHLCSEYTWTNAPCFEEKCGSSDPLRRR
jgi:hypothetical protein